MINKLYETLSKKVVSASEEFRALKKDVLQLAVSVNSLARSMVALGQAVKEHERVLGELIALQEGFKPSNPTHNLSPLVKKEKVPRKPN